MSEGWLWFGASGTSYKFSVFDLRVQWNKVGGIYVMAQRTYMAGSSVRALYIGRTNDFSIRMPQHEKWPDALFYGANEVHAMVVSTAEVRSRIEEDLIVGQAPILNEQLVHRY